MVIERWRPPAGPRSASRVVQPDHAGRAARRRVARTGGDVEDEVALFRLDQVDTPVPHRGCVESDLRVLAATLPKLSLTSGTAESRGGSSRR